MADTDIVTGSTFADLPDVRLTANGDQVVVTPEPPPQPQAAPAPAPAQYIPVPVPMPAPAPAESDQDFLRKLALARQAAEEETQARMQRELWQRVATPPALPDDDELSDPKTVKDLFRKQAEWTRNLVAENAKVLGSTVAQLNEEAQQSRMNRAELAAERARMNLWQQGMTDVDNYWGEVENVLRRDPQKYWKIRTNPVAMEQAVRMVRDHMVRSGQVVPVQQPPAPPVAAPYGNATAPAGYQQAAPIQKDPGLTRVEKMFGITFRPEDLAKRRIVNR